jgi:transposase
LAKKNSKRREWTRDDIRDLKVFARQKTPARKIARTLKRTPVHKVAGVEEAIEAVGATLVYLPPYSPDLNPIELAFSKVKAQLLKAAEHTVARLLRRIGRIVTELSAQECRNLFRHAGYVRT